MLIISKFRDYYDTASSVGIDKELVYERSTYLVDESYFKYNWNDRDKYLSNYPLPSNDFDRWKLNDNEPGYSVFVIGFCGREYVGAILGGYISTDYGTDGRIRIRKDPRFDAKITYDLDEILEFIHPPTKYSWEKDRRSKIVSALEIINGRSYDKHFLEHKTPCYLLVSSCYSKNIAFIENPNLKELEFSKVFDAFTAHQEISMYLGDVLRMREKDTVEISDEDRAKSRGFDKWSFRRDKHPSKPRRNKKNNGRKN